MAYADQGEGPVILLVHGWAAHGGFFNELAAGLARSHRVLTPTLRAHPGSGHGRAPLTIETLGDDIVQFADALGVKRFAALGWSMGAMALWAAAPALGDRLEGLIVEEMSPRLVSDGGWRFPLNGNYAAADVAATISEINTDWSAYVARFAPRMFAPGVGDARPGLTEWAAREMSKADPGAMASFWASMAAQDFRDALRVIDAPMLVVHGAESPVYPDGATEFVARAAPRGERVVIAGAGHVPHLEAPEVFFDHVAAFARAAQRAKIEGGTIP